MLNLTIQDKTFAGDLLHELELQFQSEEVTLREIITERVTQEVEAYNNKPLEYFKGFVQPTKAENTLNGYSLKKKAKIDAEKQVYIALDAFQKNAYFVLIDDIQGETLEQKIKLNSTTNISFLKLTQLVGG